MSIPAFNGNSVLPPHRGDPRRPEDMSPYPTDTVELCQRFATSEERVEILRGFMRMRAELSHNGVTDGFQWLDGSFLEDIKATENREPKDIDVVTFYTPADSEFNARLVASFAALNDRTQMKALYFSDHFMVDLSVPPTALVDFSRYWFGLFSHTRDGVWKGMLRLRLNTPAEDEAADAFLAAWTPSSGGAS